MLTDATTYSITTNTDTTALAWKGGRGIFFVGGTLGGGTYRLDFSPNGGTTYAPVAAGLAAAGIQVFELPEGLVRINSTGSTGAAVVAAIEAMATKTIAI